MGEPLLRMKAAAEELGVGLATCYRLVERGVIPAVKVPGTSIVRIRRAVLDELLKAWESTGGRRRGRGSRNGGGI